MEPQLVLVLGATGGLPEILSERLRGLNVRLRYTSWRAPAMEHLADSRPALILLNSALLRWEGRGAVARYLAAAAAEGIPVIDFHYPPPDPPQTWRGVDSRFPPDAGGPGRAGARSPLRPLLPTQDAGTAIDPREAARRSEPPHGIAFA